LISKTLVWVIAQGLEVKFMGIAESITYLPVSNCFFTIFDLMSQTTPQMVMAYKVWFQANKGGIYPGYLYLPRLTPMCRSLKDVAQNESGQSQRILQKANYSKFKECFFGKSFVPGLLYHKEKLSLSMLALFN
jgi:hypothetical protein